MDFDRLLVRNARFAGQPDSIRRRANDILRGLFGQRRWEQLEEGNAVRKPGSGVLSVLLVAATALGAGQGAAVPDDATLLQGFLPKEDLGVLEYLKENPEADGRGIVVAILDTGVELEHPALQTTSTGKPKIIDLFDATDDGYIPLPIEIKTGAQPVRGLTGRDIGLPGDLPAGSVVRLGILVGRESFPDGLASRRKGERLDDWRRAQEAWEAANASDEGPRAEATRDAFEKVMEEDEDPGDLFDVAALRRGDAWEVRIDTNGDGDLANETPLRLYREHRDVAHFPDPIRFAVACERIASDGSSIFLFFDTGGHGTHVAGIVGGYYGPNDPLNGLAPGVQFLVAKIGNGRLGGATSHNALVKAAQWAVDSGADVINISFGGSTYFDDGEEETSVLLDELVERTGVVICSSVGNEGPALSTIGSPGSARRIFGWGASISPKTQQTNYGAFDPTREEMFHFSSRGPLLNGDPGVDFISPGAALSPLPTWLLLKGDSWNGTSMASPQGAGFCALILSAARQEKLPVTPARLRRAMRVGARRIPGVTVVEQGDGVPQALSTLAALRQIATAYPARGDAGRVPHDLEARETVVDWVVTVHNATGSGGGYYERDLRERNPYRVSFDVRPDFPADSFQTGRAGFLRIMRLTSEAPWMRAPLEESFHSGGGTIRVQIDPAKLAPGLNVGRVVARDAAHPDAGIEFALVATVILPVDVDLTRPILEGKWEIAPGERRGTYVRVPAGATRARLRLREEIAEPANSYVVALSDPGLLIDPDDRVSTQYIGLGVGKEETFDLPVAGGTVLEAVAFGRWRENRAGRLAWRIEFKGVELAAEPPIAIESGRPGAGFVLGSSTWNAAVRFVPSLDREVEPLDVEWKVRPDTLFTRTLNGIPAVVEEGRALLRAGAEEKIEIEMRVGPEFEDFLDDAFFRVFDDSGREVAHGYILAGISTFTAPHEGVFRVLFTIWARGTRFFDETSVIDPVVLRSSGPHDLKVYRNALDGFEKGSGGIDTAGLVAGERRRFFLKGEDLPENSLLRGSLSVLDDRDGSPLARAPVTADTRPIAPSPAEDALSRSVDASVEYALLLAGRSDLSTDERTTALDELALCERLRSASPEPPKKKEKGKKDEEEAEKLPPDALWDLREARVRLLLTAVDDRLVEDALESLRRSLPASKEGGPEAAADRRRKEAVVDEFAAEILLRKGEIKDARRQLDQARDLDPGVPRARRLEAFILFGEEKVEETQKRAKSLIEDRTDDAQIDAVLVRSLIRLGWFDLASLRLASWPRLHPRALTELAQLREEAERERQKSPETKTAFGAVRL
jgi:subtilisin family serine protease